MRCVRTGLRRRLCLDLFGTETIDEATCVDLKLAPHSGNVMKPKKLAIWPKNTTAFLKNFAAFTKNVSGRGSGRRKKEKKTRKRASKASKTLTGAVKDF